MENNSTHSFRFSKEERLHHKSLVQKLFDEGESIFMFPLRIVWMIIDDETLSSTFKFGRPEGIGPVQMMVTVPKKRRRKAVDRVLMRRRIREAYRLNRLPLKEEIISAFPGSTLLLGFIYASNDNLPYTKIEGRMQQLLSKVSKKLISIPENE